MSGSPPSVGVFERTQALDALGHAVIATDMEGTLLYWNDAAREIYGFERHEVLGQQIYFVLPAALGDDDIDAMMRGFARGDPWDGVLSIRTKDGRWIPTVHSDRVLRDPAGKPAAIVSVSFPVARVEQAVASEKHDFVTKDIVRALMSGMLRGGHENAAELRETGKAFARRANCPGATVYLELFSKMGMGDVTLDEERPERYRFSGTGVLGRTERSAHPTCHLALGFLEGAVEGLTGRQALGAEVHCQSMGASRCVFVVSPRSTKA